MDEDGSGSGDRNGRASAQPLNFMARLEAAGAKARTTSAPWEQLLAEQANLRDDMTELRAKLRSIEDGLKQLIECGRRAGPDEE